MRAVVLLFSAICLVACALGCSSDRHQPDVAAKQPGASKRQRATSGNNRGTPSAVALFKDKVTLAELAKRKGLGDLRRLDAGHSELTDADLALLHNFSGLKILTLNVSTEITDEGLQYFKELSELQNLSLFYCPQLTGAGFAHLEDLDNLTTLDIGNNKNISDENLKHLQKLKGLQRLKASPLWGITDEGLKNVSQIQGLRQLTIKSREFTDQGLEPLAALKHLETLHLNPGSPDGSQLTSGGIEKLKQALPDCRIYHANER